MTGPIQMYRDDGFLMAEDDTGDYARQTYAGGTLTMTNVPEPEAPEEPGEPAPTLDQRVTTLEADTAELGEALDLILTGYTGEEEPADETGEGTA